MRCRGFLAGLVLLLVACGASLPGLAEASEVRWKEDYRDLMQSAEREKKLVMIDFYTSWCTFCRKLDEECMGDERVAKLINEEFVAARLDAEIQKAAARRYRPVGFPTVIFTTHLGDEIFRFSGYRTPDQVYEVVKTVQEVGPRVTELHERLDENRKDFEAHRELGRLYSELGLSDKACEHLDDARRNAPDEAAEREILFLVARARLAAKECDEAADILEDLIDDAGESSPAAWTDALEEARGTCHEEEG